MRLAKLSDLAQIQEVYTESTEYGESVGSVNWPVPFPADVLQQYIHNNELYCFEIEAHIVAVVRLHDIDSPSAAWTDGSDKYLYVSRLATGDKVRGQKYTSTVILPAIIYEARLKNKLGLRLTCLGDNNAMLSFYKQLNFTYLDTVPVISKLNSKSVSAAKFEMLLS